MQKKRAKPESLPTIWRMPDKLRAMVAPILAELDLPKLAGHKHIDPCADLERLSFVGA